MRYTEGMAGFALALLHRRVLAIVMAIVPLAGASFGGGASLAPTSASGLPPLTSAQLAGQRIIYSYSGPRPPASLVSAIRSGEAAGIILFADNISSPAQIRGVIAGLQRASRSSPLHAPLLILTDQEGGQVRRLPGPPALSEKQIGASASGRRLAGQAGDGAGRNLRAAALNGNLAPVLDVYNRRGNFIDEFGRSYSSNAATAGRLGAAFIAAQQRIGVAATAKHFPGLGAASTAENTDLRPVTLGATLARLRSVDEAPYRSAIAAGVELVMSSWAVYPAVDRRLPAGLSSAVVQGELRGRLHFRGVTITDAISAGALRGFGSLGQRGLLAARAGQDLIICTGTAANVPSAGAAVRNALASALSHGHLSRSAAVQAAERVLALRKQP
jgi:beta-N-acetylhexosaminidase